MPLNGDDTDNPANEMIRPSRPNTLENTTLVAPPDREEVYMAIRRLKLKKASDYDGRLAKLFKAGEDELVRCMHHPLCNIWSQESLPSDWSLTLLYTVLTKGDVTICSNYRGISLLTIAYRILPCVLCERLKPFVNKLIGSYQCGFRPGTSNIFTLCDISPLCRFEIRLRRST